MINLIKQYLNRRNDRARRVQELKEWIDNPKNAPISKRTAMIELERLEKENKSFWKN